MKAGALALIRVYQVAISPGRLASCKYQPTCSCYSYEAIDRYGVIKGGVLTVWRFLRCNPFSQGGFDPVR